MRHIFFIIFIFVITFSIIGNSQNIKGVSFVAPRNPFEKDPMPAITALNAEWIAVIPFAFSYINDPVVHYKQNGHWWGERPEGIKKTLELAKANCLKVMLKPQVYIHGAWVGDMDFNSKDDWEIWEKTYRSYLWLYVEFAVEHDVEMICIGTEYRNAVHKREQFWRALIHDIKAVYKGKITYSANWDDYRIVPFWDDLDFIGINAYFPLTEVETPTKQELTKHWKPIVKELSAFSADTNKKILFTEFGYMCVDKCAWRTWEIEDQRSQLALNQEAQKNAIDAIFHVFWKEDFWAGGFLWKWFPNIKEEHAVIHKDYTPQGKIAMSTIKSWYVKE